LGGSLGFGLGDSGANAIEFFFGHGVAATVDRLKVISLTDHLRLGNSG
jgi:hypothetical protein